MGGQYTGQTRPQKVNYIYKFRTLFIIKCLNILLNIKKSIIFH